MKRAGLRFALSSIALATLLPLACATGVEVPPAGEGGAGGEGSAASTGDASSSTGSGPCVYAIECAALTDACGDGACVNSECVKLPNPEKDGVACDDGKTCTQNDTCKEGACTGPLKSCPGADACNVGLCDVETDTCITVPGNEGQQCVDTDPCTQTSVCKSGACSPGQPTDCSFLNDACHLGYCEPGVGCKQMPGNDGAKCDDGFFCTTFDTCQGGVCQGEPLTCAPSGDVCQLSVCDEVLNVCDVVPGNDGAACNDNNACTASEECTSGLCGGGVPANNGGGCDDGNACTTGDVCQGGACAGTPIAACQGGDGCCPVGCDFAQDIDCGGAVYMTSANGFPGFYRYDIPSNSWSILPSPPFTTHAQLTTDGTNVLLLGDDSVIYSFSPATNQWMPTIKGPGVSIGIPVAFFKWTPSALYFLKDGTSTLYRAPLNMGGIWLTHNLPLQGSSAGTFDPSSGNLYIRGWFSFSVMAFNTATNTVVQTVMSPLSCGENSRTGSFFAGAFYERDSAGPFHKLDLATGIATNLGVTPSETHTSTDVNLATGDIYIGPHKPTGKTLQVWNVTSNMITTLPPAPMSINDHSTVVFVP